MVVLETLQVPPQDVRFTQDSISEAFGEHEQNLVDPESIETTFQMLLYGDISVDSIRTISVVWKDDLMWVVSGNRRLYVFKKLQEYGRISTVPVNVVALNKERFERMFTTENDGLRIYIRQDRTRARGDKLEDRLRIIYSKWIAHGQPTEGYPSDIADNENFNDPFFSGGSTWSPPAWPPTSSRPGVSSAEPARLAPQPRRQSAPQPRPQPAPQPRPPPAQKKKDDSWCTIL